MPLKILIVDDKIDDPSEEISALPELLRKAGYEVRTTADEIEAYDLFWEYRIGNALRHTLPGGWITLSAEPAAGAVHLCVRDNGDGIAPEDSPYVFERFHRGDEARQQEDGASGLGLAIAKSLVEAHGGSISVESTLGKGTDFTTAIPYAG
jgi:signal transduction histidine kinase